MTVSLFAPCERCTVSPEPDLPCSVALCADLSALKSSGWTDRQLITCAVKLQHATLTV